LAQDVQHDSFKLTVTVQQEIEMGRGTSIVSWGSIIAVVFAVSACTHAPVAPSPVLAAAKPTPVRVEQQARVPDEYLVTLAPDVDESVITEFYGSFGIKEINALGGETYLLVLTNDPGPQQMEDLIRDDSRFRVVQPNIIYWVNRSSRKAK
jgi:hypothetical protein